MNAEDKHRRLEEIVQQLCQKQNLEHDSLSIIQDLKKIYQDGYKHKYSKITTKILSSTKDQEQGLMTLAQNLRMLEQIIGQESCDEQIKEQIEKFYDHMNLECIRLQDVGGKIKGLSSTYNELNVNYIKLKDGHDTLQQNLQKQQTQYITILGIFASIVLAFVSGLVFSTSVLSNIDKASIYRLIFVMGFIALFVGNILNFLFCFLSKIILVQNDKVAWYKRNIVWFNGIVLIIIAINFICFVIDSK